MKIQKIIPLLLMFIISTMFVNAITLNETTSIDCTGKLSYSDNVLVVGDSYNGNFPVGLQSTAGFPEPNMFWIDEQCNPISNNTWAHPTFSYIGATTDQTNGDVYIRTISGGLVTVFILDETFTQTDSWNPITDTTSGDITIVNEYVYIQQSSGNTEYYSKNGIWLGTINITEDISCTGTIGDFFAIFQAGEDTLGLLCINTPTTGTIYEVSEDLQTLISSVSVGAIEGLHANIENNTIIAQTSSTLIRTFQFNDVLVGSFLANYSQLFCVNDVDLCSQTVHNLNPDGSVDSYCNGAYVTCPIEGLQGGCSNELVDNILSGSCGTVSCESQCDFNNQITCSSINTYTQCGNYDADVCLETGSNLFCPAGQICTTDEQGVGGCETATLPDTLLSQMVVSKVIRSTNAFEVNIVDSIYYLGSVFSSANLGFNIEGTPKPIYSSRIENYEEENIISENFNDITNWQGHVDVKTDTSQRTYNHLSATEDSFVIFDSTFGNKRITYDVTVDNLGKDTEFYVQINDENNNQIDELYFEYDKDLFDVIISRSNEGVITETIFTDDGISSNLDKIHVEVSINEQIDTLYYFITIFRTIDSEQIPFRYFTIPFSYTDIGVLQPSEVHFHGIKEHIRIFGFDVYEIPDFNQYRSIDTNNELQENFQYLQTGCVKNRIYGNEYNIPTYHFYDEFSVCITKVGNETDVDLVEEAEIDELNFIESIFGRKFTSNEKVLISVLTISIVMGMFIMLYRETEDRVLLGTGVLISGLFMFYFALINYIPTWIIIVLGVIAVGFGVKATTGTFTR